MGFWIYRSGQQFGPYSRETVQQYLADGRILPADFAWTDGSTQWLPLSQLLAIKSVPPPLPPLQPSLPRPVAAAPALVADSDNIRGGTWVTGSMILSCTVALGVLVFQGLQTATGIFTPDVTIYLDGRWQKVKAQPGMATKQGDLVPSTVEMEAMKKAAYAGGGAGAGLGWWAITLVRGQRKRS